MRVTRTAKWMALAMFVAIVIVAVVYAGAGPTHRLSLALRATARWSFLLFCLGTYGGALTTLFGSRFLALARNARDLGLAFASAHLVHVALVAWLLYNLKEPFPRVPLTVFSIGVFWIYLLAAISLGGTLS